MTIKMQIIYYCDRCGKKYTEKVPECTCQGQFVKGAIIGWAQLLENKTDTTVKVRCIICSNTKEILYYNISRQKSCGCIPRGIEVLSLNEIEIRYRCRKCGDVTIENLPAQVRCECGQ